MRAVIGCILISIFITVIFFGFMIGSDGHLFWAIICWIFGLFLAYLVDKIYPIPLSKDDEN